MGKQKKYNYAIIINSGKKQKNAYLKYNFAGTDITLYIQKNAAYVGFCLSSKKEFDEILSFKSNYLVDIMRKIFLSHAIEYSRGMKINSFAVMINDELEVKTKTDIGFPYMFSMINPVDLNVQNWRENERFKEKLLQMKKSAAKKNACVSSVYSFLASKGRQFEIDRFTNLWTSMNAYYNYLSKKYDNTLTEGKNSSKRIKRNDCKGICAALIKIEAMHDERIGRNATGNRKVYAKLLGKLAKGYSEADITELYSQLESNKTELSIDSENEIVKILNDIAHKLNVTPYGIMLLKFPYYLRCKYIHGNKCTVLFSAYEGRDIAVLKVASFFLEKYLKDAIPKMVNDSFLTDELRNEIYNFM
ncbi:MAG: hypothetical protein KBS54_04105 [Synergistaceae bacterium]|nr:hypothetical protein [Candidatus Equadaptatus faecalis]